MKSGQSFHLTPAGVRTAAGEGRHGPGVSWVGGQTGTCNFHKTANLFSKGSLSHPSPASVGWSASGWAACRVSGWEVTGHRDSSCFSSGFSPEVFSFELSHSWFRVRVELILSMGWRAAGVHFSARGCSPVQRCFLDETLCPQQKALHLVQAEAPSVWVSFWTPSWPSVCLRLHVQAAHSEPRCPSTRPAREVVHACWRCSAFPELLWVILGPLHFPNNFMLSSSISERLLSRLWLNHTESTAPSGENWHHNNAASSDPCYHLCFKQQVPFKALHGFFSLSLTHVAPYWSSSLFVRIQISAAIIILLLEKALETFLQWKSDSFRFCIF